MGVGYRFRPSPRPNKYATLTNANLPLEVLLSNALSVGGFIDLAGPAWVEWLTAIIFAVLLLLEILFMPETLYPRSLMLSRMPMVSESACPTDVEKASAVNLPRTKKLPFFNFKPIPGMRHPRPWDSCIRFLLTFRLFAVTTGVLAYCFLWYWWTLSILTMVPAAYADKSPQTQGLLFLGLFIGTLVAEVGFSGRLSDWVSNKLTRRNNNIRLPEMRIWFIYPSLILSSSKFCS